MSLVIRGVQVEGFAGLHGDDQGVGVLVSVVHLCFFFFQAEDGIRDLTVTGVQTCALPIFLSRDSNVETAFAAAGTTLSIRGTTTSLTPFMGSVTVKLKDKRKLSTLDVMKIGRASCRERV